MMCSQQDLVQIVANGGGLDMKVGPRNQQDLVQLAANAGRSGAKLVLRDVGMRPTTDLVQIAATVQAMSFSSSMIKTFSYVEQTSCGQRI
jgi:hypothetical protein